MMWKNFKAKMLRAWLHIPFGSICRFKYGRHQVTVNKQLWVTISDGRSSDAVPLNFVSPDLVKAIEAEMLRVGYQP